MTFYYDYASRGMHLHLFIPVLVSTIMQLPLAGDDYYSALDSTRTFVHMSTGPRKSMQFATRTAPTPSVVYT